MIGHIKGITTLEAIIEDRTITLRILMLVETRTVDSQVIIMLTASIKEAVEETDKIVFETTIFVEEVGTMVVTEMVMTTRGVDTRV